MKIEANQIEYKKRIGNIKGSPVIELSTIGGLHLLVVARKGTFETLAAAPHRAVARFIAKKREPDLEITELSKSEEVDPSSFEHLLPKYEELTAALRAAQTDSIA